MSKKLELLLAKRNQKRNRSQRSELDEFGKAFETLTFMEDYFRAKFEEEKEFLSKKEKEAEEKGKAKAKEPPTFRFGQMVMAMMLSSVFSGIFWFWVLH